MDGLAVPGNSLAKPEAATGPALGLSGFPDRTFRGRGRRRLSLDAFRAPAALLYGLPA